MTRVLVAGIGNVLLGDDGFGVEVARRLRGEALPAGVEVVDAGIRGLDLAYRLLDGYDLLVAGDATRRGGAPGTTYVLEAADAAAAGGADPHGASLGVALAAMRALGGRVGRVLLVGCEPEYLGERIGLSAAVASAVEPATRRVLELAAGAGAGGGTSDVEGQ